MTHQGVDWDGYTARLAAMQSATATDWELIKPIAKGRVLDVQEAIGIDIGIPGLQYGKNRFPHSVLLAASTYHLPFQDEQFDLIFSVDVIEHLEKPLLALHEYNRVCKTGGYIFIQTPNY